MRIAYHPEDGNERGKGRGKGLSNKDVARHLEISGSTVAVHLQNIYRKLSIRNRTRLAVLVANSEI
jgi:DNA-binding NarL/FixJ family response regulator